MAHAFDQSAPTNRSFKDSVFRDLFGDKSRKANALSLYNALNGTHYDDPDALEVTTIEGALYVGYQNDVSFIIGDDMVLWEHQSTKNPNMPLRGLFYFAELYARYATEHGLNRFSTKRLELPVPQYYVFYTGRAHVPDRQVLLLSDSFPKGKVGDVEVRATILRISESVNRDILDACQALAGYAHLLDLVWSNLSHMAPERAIREAINRCIDDGFLVEYLTARRSEVMGMLLDAYNEEEYYRFVQKEAVEEGIQQGIRQGIQQGIEQGIEQGREAERLAIARSLIADGILDADAAAARFNIPVEKLVEP